MSGIDLSAAVEAAADALYNIDGGVVLQGPRARGKSLNDAYALMVTAAAPLIGEAIAQAIEAQVESGRRNTPSTFLLWSGMTFAARIAREVTR